MEDSAMETENDSVPEAERFIDALKQKLDDEMTTDELQEMFCLMRTRLTEQMPGWETCSRQIKLPSELIEYLENNMMETELLSFLKHVLTTMRYYPLHENISFAQFINNYEWTRKKYHHTDVIGREKEISKLERILLNEIHYKGVWLHGPGGMGKTTCAKELCTRLDHRGLRVFDVDLKQVTTVEELIRAILTKLTKTNPHIKDESLKPELLFILQNISKDSLMVLDNIEDVYEKDCVGVEEILHCISKINIKWIVTSRVELSKTSLSNLILDFPILPLDDENAKTLLKHSCKMRPLTEAEMQVLLQISGKVPLALNLLANTLKHNTDQCLDEETLTPLVRNGMSDIIAYVFNRLDKDIQQYLLILSVLQSTPFGMDCVVDMLQTDLADASMVMALLINRQIVQKTLSEEEVLGPGDSGYCYSFHPLVLQYLNKPGSCAFDKRRALARLCKHVFHKCAQHIDKHEKNFRSAVYEIALNNSILFKTLFASVDSKDFSLREVDLTLKENKYLKQIIDILIQSPDDKIALYDKLYKKYSEKGDFFSCLLCDREKTVNMISTGNLDKAIAHVDETMQTTMLLQVTEEQQKELNAGLLYEKGRALRRKELPNYGEVMECFDIALELYDSLPNNEMLIMETALVLNAKGNVLFDQDKVDESYPFHEAAAKRAKEYIGNDYHPWVTLFEFNLGTVYVAKGEMLLSSDQHDKTPNKYYEDALQIFNSCIKRDREIGNDRLPQFADKLSYRASVLQRLNRFEEAEEDRRNAIELLEVVYSSFHHTKANAYIKHGNTLLKWRRTLRSGTGEARDKLKLALISLEKVEESVRNGMPPSDRRKIEFLVDYRAVANGGVSRDRRNDILEFCEKYDSGQPFDSDVSDSDSTQSESTDEEKRESTTSDCDMDYDQSENKDELSSGSPDYSDAKRFVLQTMQELRTQLSDEGNQSSVTKRQSSKRSISDDDSSD